MKDIKIIKAADGGTIDGIVSKSAAHRILIAAFLSGLDLDGRCDGISEDISATRGCLLRLGEARQRAAGGDSVSPAPAAAGGPAACVLPCGESGSTLRFLLPLAGALGIESDFECKGKLPDRPMGPFLDCLAEHGCIVGGRNPKHLAGKLSGGVFCLPGNISSQYVTGLLMALPLLDEDSVIRIEGRLESRPYVDLTRSVLKRAGVCTEEKENEFIIPGGQRYMLPDIALDTIERDWSNAAFWIVMDAMYRLRGKTGCGAGAYIACKGLDPGSAQGDKKIVEIAEGIIRAEGQTIDIDAADVPDLVPALAALSCARPQGSVTNIVNAGRLRFKESDRLHAVTAVLFGLGADIEEQEASLRIRAAGKLKGGTADSFGDHRIAMMAACAACISEAPVTITGADAVNKSYPAFFEEYQKLGGKIQWL